MSCHTGSNGDVFLLLFHVSYSKTILIVFSLAHFCFLGKLKHPHLIVVIENPKCLLQDMPLMKELEGSLGLEKALVHYCAFVHDGDKSTHLWMNDFVLRPILAELTGEKQSWGGGGGGGGGALTMTSKTIWCWEEISPHCMIWH